MIDFLNRLCDKIFGKVVEKPELILDEDDYLMFSYIIPSTEIKFRDRVRYYDGEIVLKNKDMSLTVYVCLMTKRVLRVANTKEMYDRIVGKSKQLEEEVRALINLGVLKEVPVREVPAFRHFLLNRREPSKVVEFLKNNKAHSHLTKGAGFYIPFYNPDTQEFNRVKSEDYLAFKSDCLERHNIILQPNDKVFIKINISQ